MKIYLYLKHFPLDGSELTGGTSKAVHGFASGLAACGADVFVLCEGAQKDNIYKTNAGYQIASFASESTKPSFKISKSLKQFIANLSSSQHHLFILNGIFHQSVYALSRLLIKHSLPYVFAPHDPYHPSIFKKNAHLKLPYWYLLEQRLLSQAKAVQVLDKRHTEWLRRLKIKSAVVEVPNGFSLADVLPESDLNWQEDVTPSLYFLGRLDAYNKGLDILIDAFSQLENTQECRLTIQGPDWGDQKKLQEKTNLLKVGEKVSFLDPDYNASSASLIVKHDIFCLPSRFEGFGLSALEAMLAGRVLLVSEVAGIAPHVEASHCGIVVKPDIKSVRIGLIELLERQAQWKEMGLSGRRYVLENLHWSKIAMNSLEDFKSLSII